MGGVQCLYRSAARNGGWTVISLKRGKQGKLSSSRLCTTCKRNMPRTGSRSRRSIRPPARSFERKPPDPGWLPKSRGISRLLAGKGEGGGAVRKKKYTSGFC